MFSKRLTDKIKLSARGTNGLDQPLTLHEYYAAENYYLKQLFLLHDVIDEMQNVIDLWYRKALEQELQIRDLRKLN